MKKKIAIVLALVLTLFALSACESQEKKLEVYEGKSAAFVGDSITNGVGLESQASVYWILLKNKINLGMVNNYGINGSSVSTKGTKGLEKTPLAIRVDAIPKHDMIFIFMGTNDFGGSVPLGTMEDKTDISFYGAYNFVLDRLQTKYPETKIVIITPIQRYSMTENKLGLTLDVYVDAVREIAQAHDLPVIDLYTEMADVFTEANVEKYMPDKIHPTEEGHVLMEEVIEKWLADNADIVFPK